LRLHGAQLQQLLKVPVPPDRFFVATDGTIDHRWPEEVEQWWSEHGPLTGADYARARQNGYTP